jgi:hypothetical protein
VSGCRELIFHSKGLRNISTGGYQTAVILQRQTIITILFIFALSQAMSLTM